MLQNCSRTAQTANTLLVPQRRRAVAQAACRSRRTGRHAATRHVVRCNAEPTEPPGKQTREEKERDATKQELQDAPKFALTPEEVFELHWGHLRSNDSGYIDAGLEVLYKFANFDPFERSKYFGQSMDLGQFERIRRVFYTRPFRPLVNHVECEVLSTLKAGERLVLQRARVRGFRTGEEGVYCLTLRHLGGRRDGWWFADSLVCDSRDPDEPAH